MGYPGINAAPKSKINPHLWLCKGSRESIKQAIYFDLNGFLVTKFQIKHLPVRVFQSREAVAN